MATKCSHSSKRQFRLAAVALAVLAIGGCESGELPEVAEKVTDDPTPAQYWEFPPQKQKDVKRTAIYVPDPFRDAEPPPDAGVWSTVTERAVREGNATYFKHELARTLFELEHPTVTLEFMHFDFWSPEYKALLSTSLHSERSPAFYLARSLPDSIVDRWYADITDYLDDWPAARDHPLTLAQGSFGGRIYCLPAEQEQWPAIMYRKDFFKEAGIFNEFDEPGPPSDWTWREFREFSRKLTRDTDGDGKTDRWGFVAEQYKFDLLYTQCMGLIPRLYIPDQSGEFTWRFNADDPWLRQAVEEIREMYLADGSVLTGVDFGWGEKDREFRGGRAAMCAATTAHAPGDYVEKPFMFGNVETKDVLGMAPYPADEHRARYLIPNSNMYGFNPTYSPEQLKAAIAWYRSWVTGYTNKLFLETLQRKNQILERPDPLPRYYLISPYTTETPLATPPQEDYFPKEYRKAYEIYRATEMLPLPRHFGLGEPVQFYDALNNMFSELLFAGESVDVDAVIASHTGKIQARCMKFKVENDREKLKAYYEALLAYMRRHLPADAAAEWESFIETKCRCW